MTTDTTTMDPTIEQILALRCEAGIVGDTAMHDTCALAHNFPAQVADPRVGECNRGSYGVQGWAEPSHCVRAHHNPRIAPSSVADPRVPEVLGPPIDLADKRPTYLVIRAADGTWHRPMTTLELAALQGLPVRNPDGTWLVLGGSAATQREHIGNMVPPPAAEAIARECLATLIAARDGGWSLSSSDIWVREEARST